MKNTIPIRPATGTEHDLVVVTATFPAGPQSPVARAGKTDIDP